MSGTLRIYKVGIMLLAELLVCHIASGQNPVRSAVFPNQAITSLAQDKSGNLWIGTEDGLVMYNGLEYLTYRKSKRINTEEEASQQEEDTISEEERQKLEFIRQITDIIDENLNNEALNVKGIAQKLCMSYSSFYAKVKAITGDTPQTLISSYRMKIAKELLETGQYNVGDVAFKVGSSSQFAFSREFKHYFGVTPSSVIKAARNK